MAGGSFKTSHPAEREKKIIIQHHRLNIRNVHHTRSLSQQTRHNKPVFTLIPARARAALFALSLARGGHPRRKENAEAERERGEEQPRPPLLHCSLIILVRMSQGRVPPPPIIQTCTCAWSASALVAALELGCFVKDPA